MSTEFKKSRKRQREFLLKQFLSREKSVIKIMERMQETFKGEQVMGRSSVNEWLQRFRKGNLSVEEGQRNGRPPLKFDERIGNEVDADPYISCIDIACRLRMPWTRVKLYLQKNHIVNISGMWVRVSEERKEARIEYCKEMIENYSELSYWDNVIFEGERIIYYNKDLGKNVSGSVKDNLRCDNYESVDLKLSSVRLRIWWTTGGYLRFRYLPIDSNPKVTSEDYIKQLKELYEDLSAQELITEDHQWIIHKNSNSSSTSTEEGEVTDTLSSLGWTTMLHPPECPDISPTDFHIFLKFLTALNTHHSFATLQELEEFSHRSFERRKQLNYFQQPIATMVERWHRVIETEGEFIATHEKVD